MAATTTPVDRLATVAELSEALTTLSGLRADE
jgi:hypothetical protein